MAVEMGVPKRDLYNEVNRLAEAVDSGSGGGGDINVVQTTGQSTTDVMSQKAITDLLEDANNTFARKDGEYVDMVVGKAIMAQVDDNGEYIPDKYAKKTELPTIAQGTGNSTTSVMSQKAATDNFALKSSVPPVVQYVGDSTTSVMSQSGVKNALLSCLPVDGSDLKVGLTKTSLVSGMTYLDCAITAAVSSGMYYFYNCTGTVTVSGNNAKVYAANCPNLTINGKTASNWQNIWIDGVATNIFGETSNGFIIRYLDGTMYQSGIGAVLGNAPSKGLFSLPASFYNTNYTVIITSMPNYTDEDYGWYRVIFAAQAYSKTQFGVMKISPTGGEQSIPRFTYLAIGRWKA